MAFESVDYLKRLLVQQNAIAIAAEGLVEKMTIEMKRERDGRIKAEQRAAKAEEALRNAGNRMRVDDDEHEELQLVCREEVEDGIRNDFEDNYPDLEDANNLALLPNSPSTCKFLPRKQVIIHTYSHNLFQAMCSSVSPANSRECCRMQPSHQPSFKPR